MKGEWVLFAFLARAEKKHSGVVVFAVVFSRPDELMMTFAVDWALKTQVSILTGR